MTDDRFWSLIEQARLDVDPKNRVRAELQKLDAKDLEAFQVRFDDAFDRADRSDIRGAAFLMLKGDCSDEDFASFRYSLILRGRAVFDAAVRHADSLAYVDVTPDHDAGFLALDIYEAKTGGDLSRAHREASAPTAGTPWTYTDDNEAKRRLPKVFAKYK